jgi:hypothetical protein
MCVSDDYVKLTIKDLLADEKEFGVVVYSQSVRSYAKDWRGCSKSQRFSLRSMDSLNSSFSGTTRIGFRSDAIQ